MLRNHYGAGRADANGVEYLNGLYSYALVLTRNQVDAEDLVYETYVRAMQALDTLRADCNRKVWLFTILRNISLNQLRGWRNDTQIAEMKRGDGVASSGAQPSHGPDDLYVGTMEAEQVRAAIQELPGHFCEVILLREYEDLSYQEIACILDCSIGTVMSRLGQARAKLRSLLSAGWTGSDSFEVGTE
jgi:RNA polymerase sigma-70 factor, ECF subfamily